MKLGRKEQAEEGGDVQVNPKRLVTMLPRTTRIKERTNSICSHREFFDRMSTGQTQQVATAAEMQASKSLAKKMEARDASPLLYLLDMLVDPFRKCTELAPESGWVGV